jgi:hypothetical protein
VYSAAPIAVSVFAAQQLLDEDVRWKISVRLDYRRLWLEPLVTSAFSSSKMMACFQLVPPSILTKIRQCRVNFITYSVTRSSAQVSAEYYVLPHKNLWDIYAYDFLCFWWTESCNRLLIRERLDRYIVVKGARKTQ